MAKRKSNQENNKGGRPVKNIDFAELDKLCELQCLQIEIANWFDISVDTLERRIKEVKGIGFAEYFSQKRGRGKIALRRKQIQIAMKGNATMLIWLGKQYLEQKDKHELEHYGQGGGPIEITNLSPEERKKRIEELLAQRNG